MMNIKLVKCKECNGEGGENIVVYNRPGPITHDIWSECHICTGTGKMLSKASEKQLNKLLDEVQPQLWNILKQKYRIHFNEN